MPFNLLLLPLLGGFVFISLCDRWKYGSLRLDGYRLLLHASIAGVFLLGVAELLVFLLGHFLHFIDYAWHDIVPIKTSGTASLAFALGLTSWWLVNRLFDPKAENERAAIDKADPLELLLREALRETKPILLTVRNGKIYVGFVTSNSSPAVQVESVKILPLASGHRRNDDKRLSFTTDYSPVYQKILDKDSSVAHVTSEDFEIVIPYREIESANLFDAKVYQMFFAPDQPSRASNQIEIPKRLSP
jgi:hypothetical protein